MTNHPNVAVLKKLYDALSRGDLDSFLAPCAEGVTFQIPGKSPLAGKYTRSSLTSLFTKLQELSAGSYQFEVHDILSSDQHGTVLLTERLGNSAKPVELRMVHVWRFEGQKPLAGYAYPRDLYQFDNCWGG